jgi:hypothetical protein
MAPHWGYALAASESGRDTGLNGEGEDIVFGPEAGSV